jgi:type III secretion protein C
MFKRKTFIQLVLSLCAWACCLLQPSAALAQEPPWRRQAFDLQANGEPLNLFLSRILTMQGIPTVMSPAVASGRVNGRIKGQAETIFKELSETFGLMSFYDGGALYVYSLGEVSSRLMRVAPIDLPRVDRTMRQMRLTDTRYPLRVDAVEGQILVSGPPRYVDLASELIARITDAPSQTKLGGDVRVFRLKYAKAADTTVSIGGVDTLVPGVATVLNEIVGGMRSNYVSGGRSQPRNLQGLRGSGQLSIGRGNQQQPVVDKTSVVAGGLSSYSAALAGRSDADTAVSGPGAVGMMAAMSANALPQSRQSMVVSDTPLVEPTVRADVRINAVIVRDTPERMAMYQNLIESLDVDIPLMEIEATIIDIADDKSEQLGVDWRVHGSRVDISSSPNGLAGRGNSIGGTNSAGDLINNGTGVLSAGSGLVGTLLFGNTKNYFLSRLNAMAENGDARMIATPRVLTLDNTEAVLQSTKDFYVRVAGKDQVDLFNVTSGLVMRVTPSVIDDGQGRRFKLNVRIEDGNANGGPQVDQIPVVNRNAIATQAIIGDGQSMLIGGYKIDEQRSGRSGVPVLSDLPFIGKLFGQRGMSANRVERMFLITARLVTSADMATRNNTVAGVLASQPVAAAAPEAKPQVPAARTRVAQVIHNGATESP